MSSLSLKEKRKKKEKKSFYEHSRAVPGALFHTFRSLYLSAVSRIYLNATDVNHAYRLRKERKLEKEGKKERKKDFSHKERVDRTRSNFELAIDSRF